MKILAEQYSGIKHVFVGLYEFTVRNCFHSDFWFTHWFTQTMQNGIKREKNNDKIAGDIDVCEKEKTPVNH